MKQIKHRKKELRLRSASGAGDSTANSGINAGLSMLKIQYLAGIRVKGTLTIVKKEPNPDGPRIRQEPDFYHGVKYLWVEQLR